MFTRRIRYWFRNRDRARLLREEMEIHLDMKTQELMEDGMSESDARYEARRQFGNPTRIGEEARGTWIARWFSDLMQDVVYATRVVRKQPGFTVVAVASAALGIGACSMIFGIANFALFRPLPVTDASRVLALSGKSLTSGEPSGTISYPDYLDVKQARSLEGVSAYFPFMAASISSGTGEPQRYWGSFATANYFDVVKPPFLLGHGFDSTRDDKIGETPVIVLSHQLWQSRFGGDRGIVGQTIEFNRRKVTVIGVTAPGFRGTEVAIVSDFWVPWSMIGELHIFSATNTPLNERGAQWLLTVARLRDGFTVQQAAAEVDVIGRRIAAAYPANHANQGLFAERAGQVNASLRRMIVVFFALLIAVSLLVLLTACANVANLLLARASARQKEIATRLAIGAGRGRLVRQLLTESVLLALLGGIGGYLVALVGASSLGKFKLPLILPFDFTVTLDYRVVLFCCGLSVLTGIVFGLVPALRSTRPDLVGALKNETVRLGKSRWFSMRNVLVVAQVTICMVLLICSGLFLRSLGSTHMLETGIPNHNILLMNFDPTLSDRSEAATMQLLQAVLDRAKAAPGVESASITTSVPLSMGGISSTMVPEDKVATKDKNQINVDAYSITPGFFETLGIPFRAGEDFRPGVPTEKIVILNQAAADRAFPNQNAIGQRVLYEDVMARVAGVVANAKSRTIGEEPHGVVYSPMMAGIAESHPINGLTLMLKTRVNPSSYAVTGRDVIRAVDPGLAVFDVRTFDVHLDSALLMPRAAAFLFGLAGGMGLLIAIVGIYGVVSFAVARQTREIGIRMALGGRRSQVLGMVLMQGLWLTVAGSAIGLLVALAVSRLTASLLYGVSPTDPITFACVPLLLLAITTAACLIPARRAASLDPIGTLRYE